MSEHPELFLKVSQLFYATFEASVGRSVENLVNTVEGTMFAELT